MVIAVDAMGGDIPVHAPVEAAVRAANDFEQEIILVGNRDQVVTELDKHTFPKKLIEVVHSSETVGMDESPALSLRQKKILPYGSLLIFSRRRRLMRLSVPETPVPPWQQRSLY